jgi:hypothetical protein
MAAVQRATHGKAKETFILNTWHSMNPPLASGVVDGRSTG